MSNYGILLDKTSGLPKWQVFYGSEQPPSEGWHRVAGALPDESETSAKWYRPYSTVKASRKKAADSSRTAQPAVEPEKKPLSFWDKLKAVRNYVRDEVVGVKSGSKKAARVKSKYNTGDRVILRSGDIGYVQAVLGDGDMYNIYNTNTGEHLDMQAGELLYSEKAEANFAVGDTVERKHGRGAGVAGTVAAIAKDGRLKVDDADGKSGWYVPDELRHVGSESEKALGKLATTLKTAQFGHTDRVVAGALMRALQSARATTTVNELLDDAMVTGNRITRADAHTALTQLSQLYEGIAYDPQREMVDFGGARKGLEKIAEASGASMPSGPYGWSPKVGANEVFSAPGMEFKLPAGSFVSTKTEDGLETKAEITHGLIVAHDGGAAILEVTDSNGTAYKIKSSEVEREDGRSFWRVATDQEGKAIKPDPFDPSLYGDVVRDNFWLLRDRESARDVTPGDMVKSLPYALADADGKFSDEQVTGRVLDRMLNTGLLRVQFEDGRVLDVSPRMVALSREMNSMSEVHQLSLVRRAAVYGSTFTFPSGTRVSFGDPTAEEGDPAVPKEGDKVEMQKAKGGGVGTISKILKTGNKVRYTITLPGKLFGTREVTDVRKTQFTLLGRAGMTQLPSSIRLSYPSRAHFEKHFSEAFIKGDDEGWFSRTFSGNNTADDMFEGKENAPPYIPNQSMMRTISQLYPAADKISARAYNDHKSKEFIVEIGPGDSAGKAFEMTEVLAKAFPVAPMAGGLNVRDHDAAYPVRGRVDVTTDGNSLYIRIGEGVALGAAAKKALEPLKTKNAKSVKLYHAVTASKRRAFELLGKEHPELFQAISRFTYDPAGKRFVADVSDFGEGGAVVKGLKELFPDAPIFESTDRAWWYDAGKGPVARIANNRASVLNQIKSAKQNSELPPITGFGHVDGHELFKIQKEVVNFITAPGQQTVLLANDQGTGKTPVMTASIMRWADQGKVKRSLIVVPAAITGNWKEEIEGWTGMTPEFAEKNLVMLQGSDRKEAYAKLNSDNPPLMAVISYDTLLRDYKELATIPWDAMALDEAQNIRNLGNKRERVIKKVFDKAPLRIAATGTPIENSPEDMFSIMEFLQPDVFGDKKKFDNDFIEYDDVTHKDSTGKERTSTVPVGVKNIGLLRSKLLPIMVRVDKARMNAAMNEELGPALKAELGKDIKLMGARNKYPWPVLQKRESDGKYEATFRPEDREHLIKQDRYEYPDYWDAHDKAIQYLAETGGNPLTKLVLMQQVADDPSLFADYIKGNEPLKKFFSRFDERNPDGTYRYKNPKRDKMLATVKNHFADPKNGKIIIFSQSTAVLDKLEDWLYSDPDVRKRLGMTKEAHDNYLITDKKPADTGVIRYTGGMKSGMVKKEAAAILKRLNAGEVSGEESAAAQKERAYVRHAFQNDDKVQILLASDAAQTGLTLTAANAVINYNLGWNPKAMDQRIDRAHRIDIKRAKALADQGGARDVTAYNIIAEGTADERKMPKLAWKDHLFDLIVAGQAQVDEDAIVSAHNESEAELFQRMYDDSLGLEKRKKRVGEAYVSSGNLREGEIIWL